MRRALPSAVLVALAAAALCLAVCRGRPAGPNVVLVTIETFRKDHLGKSRDGVPLTPNLDALARRGTSFERAYAASSFTLPSLHTIATGEPPAVHRVRFWTDFGNRYTEKTLAERMQGAGYTTGFVYSAYEQFKGYYPIMGRGWTEPPAEFKQEDAPPVLGAATAWLDRHGKEPFFLWVHLFEPHTPYGPDDRFVKGLADVELYHKTGQATFPVQEWLDKAKDGRDSAFADALYAADIRAADDALGQLLAALEARGLTSNTVVCVSSDHGENLSGDPEPRWDHGVSTDEQLIRVPLVFAGPGVSARGDTSIARHLDFAPTLLHFAGGDVPKAWPGRDLFGTAPPPLYAISECTVNSARKSPMYSVTDGSRSLRIETKPAPWRVEMRDERSVAVMPFVLDLKNPPELAKALVDEWNAQSEYVLRREPEANRAGDDSEGLSEEQKGRVLQGMPYGGGGQQPPRKSDEPPEDEPPKKDK